MTQATDTTQQTDDDFDDTKPEAKPEAGDAKFSQADLDRVVEERLSRERKKYADYSDLKKKAAAAMTDNEKAIADAEDRGKTAAQQAYGSRLVRAEMRAEAAGKIPKETLDGFLEYADLSRFVGDDGEPDVKAIGAALKKLGAGAETKSTTTNYDGGARASGEKPNDMNDAIRNAWRR